MGKQIQELLAGCLFMIGHSGDDIIQITPRVDVMRLACSQ